MTSLRITDPVRCGSLEAYIQTVNSFPILTQEQETRSRPPLAPDRRSRGGAPAGAVAPAGGGRDRARLHGLRPAAGRPDPGRQHRAMKAVKRFDPERGVRLVSFAVHWIRAEIHEFILRNWRIVKVATTKAQRKLFFNLRSLKQGLGTPRRRRREGDREAARRQARGSGRDGNAPGRPGRRARAVGRRRRGQPTRRSPISPRRTPSPAALLEQEETARLRSAGLTQALEALDARSRRIIEARWLNEKEPATLHDLAGEFGVSAERVRQIEAKALAKMKGVIAAQGGVSARSASQHESPGHTPGLFVLRIQRTPQLSTSRQEQADVVQDRRGALPVRREEPQPPFAVEDIGARRVVHAVAAVLAAAASGRRP